MLTVTKYEQNVPISNIDSGLTLIYSGNRFKNVSGELAGTIGQRLTTTTDYSGPWQFENGTLDRINIPGGFVKGNNVYFYISDHQGNVRQVWNATTNLTVQDNHYYPYGSLFGESASTEYLNVMSLISNSSRSNAESGGLEDTELNGEKYDAGAANNPNSSHNLNITISSPSVLLSVISDNAYRYGGKEWISFRGLNAYDFTARLYDPSLGRFHNPDPLNSSYPHLSPYLYCTANPINATDPSGMAVIFDKDGNFLDTSVEGFTGEVLIYNGESIMKDDGTILDFSEGNCCLFSDFSEEFLRGHLTPYDEGNLSISAQVSIWNNVIGHFDGMQVYDETFSMDKILGGKVGYLNELEYSDASWGTHFRNNDGSYLVKPFIGGTGLFVDSYEATVENLASSIIVHEWYSHGMKHNSDALKSHRLAYKNVINFIPLWNKTTDMYKKFTMKMLMKFINIETGRKNIDNKYKELYEKYGK